MEKDGVYYDVVYKQGGFNQMYHKHYKHSIYYPIWMKTVEILKKEENHKIIDIGCGVGQFANLLFDHGFHQYTGLDFSDEAIAIAKKVNPSYTDQFKVDNAYTTNLFEEDYDIVIIFEVLEHLAGDLDVLNKIKSGSTVLLSVPNFDDVSHVRYFTSEDVVVERYKDILTINQLHTFHLHAGNKIYLCEATKI